MPSQYSSQDGKEADGVLPPEAKGQINNGIGDTYNSFIDPIGP